MNPLITFPDGLPRCHWCAATAQYTAYHDEDWGYPVADERRLFEKLCLESFQSGLSWRTILEKRENFRKAFCGFDFHQMAQFDEAHVQRLLANAGIVRHRGKIEAAIHNARRAVELVGQEGSLAAFIWRYEPKTAAQPGTQTQSPESLALSKELKQRGWKFVGPTTAYAFMQAMGLVNDHFAGCAMHEKAEQARQAFKRPT